MRPQSEYFSVGLVYLQFETYDNFLLPKYNVFLIYVPIFVYLTDSIENDIYLWSRFEYLWQTLTFLFLIQHSVWQIVKWFLTFCFIFLGLTRSIILRCNSSYQINKYGDWCSFVQLAWHVLPKSVFTANFALKSIFQHL